MGFGSPTKSVYLIFFLVLIFKSSNEFYSSAIDVGVELYSLGSTNFFTYSEQRYKGYNHPATKIEILDPYNNRSKIADVATGAKGVYIFTVCSLPSFPSTPSPFTLHPSPAGIRVSGYQGIRVYRQQATGRGGREWRG